MSLRRGRVALAVSQCRLLRSDDSNPAAPIRIHDSAAARYYCQAIVSLLKLLRQPVAPRIKRLCGQSAIHNSLLLSPDPLSTAFSTPASSQLQLICLTGFALPHAAITELLSRGSRP